MTALRARDLNRATLARQGLLRPIDASPADAVRSVASLQAQHPEWPPVALASRAANAGTADLAEAVDRREVVRSSLMRITIHVVAADDLWPMFSVVQPLRLSQWKLLLKADPVDSPLGRRMTAAHDLAIAALRERPRTSLEIDRLMAAEVGEQPIPRAAWRHLAAFVPLVHVPHDGEGYGRSRYAVASDWLDRPFEPMDLDAARVHVARRYLAAFGPASIEDLAAYVGRGKGGISPWRQAVAALQEETVELRDDAGRVLVDLANAPRPDAGEPAPPRLLARWDSVLLSHETKHRDRIIAPEHRDRVFSRNADVLPTFLLDGFVAGTWELDAASDPATIRLRPFGSVPRAARDALLAEADRVLSLVAPGRERSVELVG